MSENDDFPYRNNIYTKEDKLRVFNNLISSDLIIHKNPRSVPYIPRLNINLLHTNFLFKGMVYYLTYNSSDYYNIQILSDFFNDDCRMKCGFGSNISPFDYYIKNKNNIIENMKRRNVNVSQLNLREEIYDDMTRNHTRDCSIHNPSIIN